MLQIHIYIYTINYYELSNWFLVTQRTASSEKNAKKCASGAGAKRQARDAAHIAGDWNPQDGHGFLFTFSLKPIRWKACVSLIKKGPQLFVDQWWSIISFSWVSSICWKWFGQRYGCFTLCIDSVQRPNLKPWVCLVIAQSHGCFFHRTWDGQPFRKPIENWYGIQCNHVITQGFVMFCMCRSVVFVSTVEDTWR